MNTQSTFFAISCCYNDICHSYHLLQLFQSAISGYAENHADREPGHFLCAAQPTFVQPGWVVSESGEWVIAVEAAGIEQVVMVAKCLYRDKPCEYRPACYR